MQAGRLVTEIKNRGDIPKVEALTRIDRGHEEDIRGLLRQIEAVNGDRIPNKFEKGLRRNTLSVIAKQMEKISQVNTPPHKDPRYECLISEETSRQVVIAETLLRSMDPSLDSEYKNKAVVLSFGQRQHKNLNLTGARRPIFSPWTQMVWALNFYHFDPLSRPQFIKSADFFELMKKLLEFEDHPRYKTLLAHNYLESLPEMKTDDDCKNALKKAKRLYWRSFSWDVKDSDRGAYLANSCACFVTGKTNKDFVEEIDPDDLFVEFADKIMYGSRDQLPEIKVAASSDLTDTLVAFVKTFLASDVRTSSSVAG